MCVVCNLILHLKKCNVLIKQKAPHVQEEGKQTNRPQTNLLEYVNRERKKPNG